MVKLIARKLKINGRGSRKGGSTGHADFSKATCQQKPGEKLRRNDQKCGQVNRHRCRGIEFR